MTIVKTLMLAGVTALSIGAGGAMAQETGAVIDYWGEQNVANAHLQAVTPAANQDVGQIRTFRLQFGPAHNGPSQYDGVGGEGSGG